MNVARARNVWAGAAISFASLWLPALARACPMCFSGNNSNQDAFLYGSLLLMFVPVTAIGSLVYWAWRRSKLQDLEPRDPLGHNPEPPSGETALPPRTTGAPALRAAGRR